MAKKRERSLVVRPAPDIVRQANHPVAIKTALTDWGLFYQTHLGIKHELEKMHMPPMNRVSEVIIVSPKVSAKLLFSIFRQFLPQSYTVRDLRELTEKPRPMGWYATALTGDGTGEHITLREQLLKLMKNFLMTSYIPNTNTTIACHGSAFTNGDVPHINIFGNGMFIDTQDAFGDAHAIQRPRVHI